MSNPEEKIPSRPLGVEEALEEYLNSRLARTPGATMRCNARAAVGLLKDAIARAHVPLKEFVERDLFAPVVAKLETTHNKCTLDQYKGFWREAFKFLCKSRILPLTYDQCTVSPIGGDPFDPERVSMGLFEAWSGIFPRSVWTVRLREGVEQNASVAAAVRREFQLAMENLTDCKTTETRVANWHAVRKAALALRLESLKEMTSIPGSQRLLEYFQSAGYHRESSEIRRLWTVYNSLARAGIMGNPFKLRERLPDIGMRYTIDFSKLRPQESRERFVTIEGRRHKKIEGVAVECRLRNEDVKRVAEYGNPALRSWRARPPHELMAVFREAQENQLARTILFFPPRPIELLAMNWRGWQSIEGDEGGQFTLILNNVRANKKKRRPNWVVPKTMLTELEALWDLRRAAYAGRADIDRRDVRGLAMVRSGIPMWVSPRQGIRMGVCTLKKALCRALLRMGIPAERARHATAYWMRKGHEAFARNAARGVGDKYLAEQAGHSESVMRAKYDGPEALIRAEHLSASLWAPLGVSGSIATTAKPAPAGGQSSFKSGMECLSGSDLTKLADALMSSVPSGAGGGASQEGAVWAAAQQAGLLCSFEDASAILGVEMRTLERWAQDGHLAPIHIGGRRLVLRGQVNALAECLSPDEAGRQLELSGRQVRNLVADGKIPGAITQGKKILIPIASLRAFERKRAQTPRFLNTRLKTSVNVGNIDATRKNDVNTSVFRHT